MFTYIETFRSLKSSSPDLHTFSLCQTMTMNDTILIFSISSLTSICHVVEVATENGNLIRQNFEARDFSIPSKYRYHVKIILFLRPSLSLSAVFQSGFGPSVSDFLIRIG